MLALSKDAIFESGGMAIARFSETEFRELLSANFTPSATIKTPELLFGREKSLKQIERSLASPGRQVFIYGDRGVGKTSLAVTAATLLASAHNPPIYVVCSRDSTFGEVIRAIGNSVVSIQARFEKGGGAATFGLNVAGNGATFKRGEKAVAAIEAPNSINEALDIIRYVLAKHPSGSVVIIIDEMERIDSLPQREIFAEFIKNIPEVGDRAHFLFCGIGTTVNELIGSHPSAGRILEPIQLDKLHHNYLWEIIQNVADKVGVRVEEEVLVRISQISDGFPHYVHLIGESMFWSAFDDTDEVTSIKAKHFKAGIDGAINRAEPALRLQYEKATMKTRNTEDYEEALWAVADTTSMSRQVTEIYESSYKRIMARRKGRAALPRDKFNQRLLALRGPGHGNVLIGYGAGWFGYRENILRGYVRLRAEGAGVELGKDHVIRS